MKAKQNNAILFLLCLFVLPSCSLFKKCPTASSVITLSEVQTNKRVDTIYKTAPVVIPGNEYQFNDSTKITEIIQIVKETGKYTGRKKDKNAVASYVIDSAGLNITINVDSIVRVVDSLRFVIESTDTTKKFTQVLPDARMEKRLKSEVRGWMIAAIIIFIVLIVVLVKKISITNFVKGIIPGKKQ